MSAAAPAAERLARTAELMGTVFSAHVIGTPSDLPQVESAIASCFAHLSELEAVFSPFRPSSDITRLRTGAAPLDDLDPRVAVVADACRAVETETAGRFSAWRDGWFDPTGYVKGWAADVAAQRWLIPLLTMPGVTAVGLNAGGDVRVSTAPGADWVWRIGIADPAHPGEVVATVELRDGAVATSGIAERGAHIVDPRDGSVADGLLSATVVAADLATADTWATAAVVAGDDLSWVATAPVSSGLIVARDGAVRRWAGGIEVSPVSW